MAEEIVIRIVGDAKGVKPVIDALKTVGKIDDKNAKEFKKTSKQFQENQKKNEKSVEDLGGGLSSLKNLLIGAFAVTSIVSFGKELFATAVQMEAFEKRARTVFGDSIGIIEKFGRENARSLGLTQSAFLGATAAIGDILVPLGLTRKRAAEMSAEAVKLGAALKEFSGDQREASEIANIVAKSFTGEVEGLKGLGVVINQNDKDFKALIKSKITTLGLTEQQAKAEAIFETVIARSSDALSQFETNTDSLARQQAILSAESAQLTETIAELLTPAILASVTALNELADGLNVVSKAEVSLFTKIRALAGDLDAVTEVAISAAKAEIALADASNEAADATEEQNIQLEEQIRNIFFLKNAIDVLRKEQSAQGTSLQRISQITQELIPLQAELNKLIGKGGAAGAYAELTKEVGDLNKELLNQAVLGNINAATVDKLEKATQRLIKAEVELQIATTKTLEFKEAESLELLKIEEDTFDKRSKLLEAFQEKQRLAAEEEKRLNESKRDVSIAITQQTFAFVSALQDRQLSELESNNAKEISGLQDKRDKNIITEEEFEKRKQAILKETDDRRREILTRQAQLQKTAAIIEATINTAVAVTNALEDNVALAGLVAILGAAEIATIAAQPIPEFHEGKKPELKDGEIMAKILKSESVIPPEQSKKYKGAIDSMIDGNLEKYVFQEYMVPMMKSMGKSTESVPYNDVMLWNNQKRQIGLSRRTNELLEGLQPNGNAWRTWR